MSENDKHKSRPDDDPSKGLQEKIKMEAAKWDKLSDEEKAFHGQLAQQVAGMNAALEAAMGAQANRADISKGIQRELDVLEEQVRGMDSNDPKRQRLEEIIKRSREILASGADLTAVFDVLKSMRGHI